MVMNYDVFNVNLHMMNHYKRINSAKSIVNTSPPKSFISRNKNSSTTTSRRSTPCLLRRSLRSNSQCDVNVHSNLHFERSSSRFSNTTKQQSKKTIKPQAENNETPINPSAKETKLEIFSQNTKETNSRENSFLHSSTEKSENLNESIPNSSKVPIPTPRLSLTTNTSVSDHEYLQFSLRITEDIIRYSLYNLNDMQRVFNSHIEANRGRLDATKMHEKIDQLCRELNILEGKMQDSDNKISTTDMAFTTFSHEDKILNECSGNNIQDKSVLVNVNVPLIEVTSPTDSQINVNSLEANVKNLEINDSTEKHSEIFLERLTVDQNPGILSQMTEIRLQLQQEQLRLDETLRARDTSSQSIIPKNSNPTDEKLPPPSSTEKNESSEKKSVAVSCNDSFENFFKPTNDFNQSIELILKKARELIENENKSFDTNITTENQKENSTNNNNLSSTSVMKNIANNDVSNVKNELTQTPFSEEITNFIEKLVSFDVVSDNNQDNSNQNNSKDILNVAGSLDKNIIIENNDKHSVDDTSESINCQPEDNFITTVNTIITDKINDLFKTNSCKENSETIKFIVNDYNKYEIKDSDDKYGANKYKTRCYTYGNSNLTSEIKLVNKNSGDLSEISLSEGEIPINSGNKILTQTIMKQNVQNHILDQLKKYEYKIKIQCDLKNTTRTCVSQINKYELNKMINNYSMFKSNDKYEKKYLRNLEKQEYLLSDGEIRNSSESDEWKTNSLADSGKSY